MNNTPQQIVLANHRGLSVGETRILRNPGLPSGEHRRIQIYAGVFDLTVIRTRVFLTRVE